MYPTRLHISPQLAYASSMHPETAQLEERSLSVRTAIVEMLARAGSGHSAGALGMADVFVSLYFSIIKHRPQEPDWPERDRVIVSNGHICPVWYATLAEAGYFSKTKLHSLRQIGSPLQGHPHYGSLPGIENSSGLLAQGLSIAAGIAAAHRLDGKLNRVYAILSDGEHNEGQTWEAYLWASAKKLTNLTVLIDRNHIQIDGFTEDVLPLQPMKPKLEAFGWNVLEIDGHNHQAVIDACHQAASTHELPTAIICHTTPGKGVDFMENKPEWHGQTPTPEQAVRALQHLRKP